VPAPGKGKSSRRRWWLWVLLLPLLLLGLTYLTGRMVEPVRAVLAKVPAVGQPLFGKPVWAVLWNKPATPKTATAERPKTDAAQAGEKAPANSAVQDQMDAAAARIAAADVKETDLKTREAALKAGQEELAKQQAKLAAQQAEVAGLKQQLAGQLRTEKDRVEIVRAMSRTAQASFFGALTDDETLAILKYMTADEVAAILGKLDPYRAARLFERLSTVAPSATTP
jgi:flagellar motility protein MotE (MotC chaperone)